jgi:hypothetical protein
MLDWDRVVLVLEAVNGDGECEANGSPPKIEKRNRRRSLSRLLVDREGQGGHRWHARERERWT